MTEDAVFEFEQLSDLKITRDGKYAVFRLDCQGGNSATIACALKHIIEIVTQLTNCAVFAAEQSGTELEDLTEGMRLTGEPIPAAAWVLPRVGRRRRH